MYTAVQEGGAMNSRLRRDALIVLGTTLGMSARFIPKALCLLPDWDKGHFYFTLKGSCAHLSL